MVPNSISVCMATYNGEKYIRQQILSIILLLSPEDELIVSDDGSIDQTLSIINSFFDPRIRVSYNTGHRGPSGNFENAIRQAKNEFILLADQDDIWLPDKVKDLRKLLRTTDLILSDCQVVDEKGNLIHESFFKYRGSRQGFWNNLLKNSYIGCCMAFRREITSYILPFPKQVHMHDWWIGLLVEVKGRVCYYDRPLIRYVRHGGNASPTGEKGYGFIKRLQNRVLLLIHVAKRLLA